MHKNGQHEYFFLFVYILGCFHALISSFLAPPPLFPPISCTIANLKIILEAKTRVLPEKQKIIGLTIQGGKVAKNEHTLDQLVVKDKRGPVRFMLIGTPEVRRRLTSMKYAVRDEEAQSDACSAKARPRAAEGRRLIATTSLKPPHDVSREGERCRHRMRRIQSSHRGARMLD
jgi:hypothetical protein